MRLSSNLSSSISRIDKIKILKLEFNELTEEIPQELRETRESYGSKYISYNKLISKKYIKKLMQC